MFKPQDILYEDNHLLIVNKQPGDLVQPDQQGTSALENEIKEYIKRRDSKPGAVFLGVVHRIDRPVSGAVLFAKTSKALSRLNEMIKNRTVGKIYWAIIEELPEQTEAELTHYILRDGKTNRSKAFRSQRKDAKEGRLKYRLLSSSSNYHLLEIELFTGRHHQIRAQLSAIGAHIRGDVKYGASRTIPGGGISLHSRRIELIHLVTKVPITVTAPAPKGDNLWKYFEDSIPG